MANERIEISYDRAPIGKRLLATLVDFFLFGVLAAILFALGNMAVGQMDFYKETLSVRNSLQAESGLYVEGEDLVSYCKNHEELFVGVRGERDYIRDHLEAFYNNPTFLSEGERTKALGEYNSRKAEAKHDGVALFTLEDGKLVDADVNPSWQIDFYFNEVDNYAQPIFVGYEPYLNTTRTIWISAIAEVYISMSVSYFVFYVSISLWVLKRGRGTIGRSLFKIGMVGKDGLNVKTSRFVLRALFSYVAYVILDIAFLAPLFISSWMLFMSKRNQSLSDYVFANYLVDTSKDDIYLDVSDYLERKKIGKKASIENKDFELDNHGL